MRKKIAKPQVHDLIAWAITHPAKYRRTAKWCRATPSNDAVAIYFTKPKIPARWQAFKHIRKVRIRVVDISPFDILHHKKQNPRD